MQSGVSCCHALLAALALAAAAGRCAGEQARAGDDSEEESDSAPFAVVVEHGAGAGVWRCGAALVSLHTALTSARCARGPHGQGGQGGGEGGEVWARAPHAASRVLRVAVAANADLDAEAGSGDAAAWSAGAAARDVALLELAEALAGARPILLAAVRADCAAPRDCYLVRALGAGAGRLRIVELALRAARECWQRGAPDDERALCLTGPSLCQSERGAGVVCGGKLCGVLSASREHAAGCGAPHAAASAPRWRRFLHCAHTRGACGRDGECARLCTERWLADQPPSAPPSAAPFASLKPRGAGAGAGAGGAEPDSEWPAQPALTVAVSEAGDIDSPPPAPSPPPRPTRSPPPATRSPPHATRSPPSAPPAPPAPPAPTARHAHEFEPNRADFTAGEYGDNAADYQAPADEPPAPTPAPGPPEVPIAIPAPPDPFPVPTAPAPPAPRAVLARVSPESLRAASAALPPPPLASLLCLTSSIYVIVK